MNPWSTRTLTCLLAGATLVAFALQLRDEGQSPDDPASVSMRSNRVLTSRSKSSSRPARGRSAHDPQTIPTCEWSVGLENQKRRNFHELNYRLAHLEDRIKLTEIQVINLRRHMERWYSSMESELEKNGRWSWSDHGEISWTRICASLFVADAQREAHRGFSEDLARQRKQNEELAFALVDELKLDVELPKYTEDLLVSFLVSYQTFEQGWGQSDLTPAPWSHGLRTGQFDPLAGILDSAQLSAISQLLADNAGQLSRKVAREN